LHFIYKERKYNASYKQVLHNYIPRFCFQLLSLFVKFWRFSKSKSKSGIYSPKCTSCKNNATRNFAWSCIIFTRVRTYVHEYVCVPVCHAIHVMPCFSETVQDIFLPWLCSYVTCQTWINEFIFVLRMNMVDFLRGLQSCVPYRKWEAVIKNLSEAWISSQYCFKKK
jgi:hypothetical protein